MTAVLTHQDRMRLAVESCCSMSTISRFMSGKNIRPSLRARIMAAAERLQLDVLRARESNQPCEAAE